MATGGDGLYAVRVMDRQSGRESALTVRAAGPGHAMDQAEAEGWLVCGVQPMPEPPAAEAAPAAPQPPTPTLQQEMHAVRAEVRALRSEVESLRSSGLMKRPVNTIARGVVLGLLAWLALGLVLAGLVAGAGVIIQMMPDWLGSGVDQIPSSRGTGHG